MAGMLSIMSLSNFIFLMLPFIWMCCLYKKPKLLLCLIDVLFRQKKKKKVIFLVDSEIPGLDK